MRTMLRLYRAQATAETRGHVRHVGMTRFITATNVSRGPAHPEATPYSAAQGSEVFTNAPHERLTVVMI
jgi:hypothetical protein